MTILAMECVSPELALVDPELREAARAAMPVPAVSLAAVPASPEVRAAARAATSAPVVTPELALVDPELRALAIALLPVPVPSPAEWTAELDAFLASLEPAPGKPIRPAPRPSLAAVVAVLLIWSLAGGPGVGHLVGG
jgi:hypothetical protein